MSAILLSVSILLATIRNIFSKNISDISFGTKDFFCLQGLIFSCGGIVLGLTGVSFNKMEAGLVYCSLIYGTLLLAAQYFYTLALKNGKTGICSMIYSLGFVFPTLLGSILWKEPINAVNIIGVALVVVMIVLCGIKSSDSKEKSKSFFLPIVAAMLASGGLGIMQKVQQSTKYSGQTPLFLLIAFLFAGIVSFVLALCSKKGKEKCVEKKFYYAALIGIAFGASNLCNTILTGRLKAAVVFPILNIGTIAASIILGMIIYKERCTKKDIIVLAIGIAAIVALKV